MIGPLGDDLDDALAKLKEIRHLADNATRMMKTTSHTLMSKRRLLSVTVEMNGAITALTFNGESYRSIAPAELAQIIIDTVNEARKICTAEASKALHELWPEAGTDFDAMSTASSIDDMMTGLMKVAGSAFTEADVKAFEDSWKAEK